MKKLLDILAFIFLLANVVVSCVFYFTTDMIAVPTHWNTAVQMDAYGETWMILLLAGISVVVYLLMVWSEHHHVINLPFKVKHEPSARPFIDMCLAWTNMFVMLLLLYVDICVAQYLVLNNVIIFAVIILLVVIGFYYCAKIYKCGR